MKSKIEILKQLFIREKMEPDFIQKISDYATNPIRTEIEFTGVTFGDDYSTLHTYEDYYWADEDGDFINHSFYTSTLRTYEPQRVVAVSVDPNANPKDVIRVLNKIAKWINDEYKDKAYDRLKKEVEDGSNIKEIGDEYQQCSINSDSNYRDVLRCLILELEEYERELERKIIEEQKALREYYNKQDIRTLTSLGKPMGSTIDTCNPNSVHCSKHAFNDLPF